jgi:tRNA(adenine34) deaminase
MTARSVRSGWSTHQRRRRRRVRSRIIRMASLRLTTSRHPDCSEIDLAMMARAIELARQAAAIDEVPVGAVVYRGAEIIAEASNNREASKNPVGHAELLAVAEAGKRLGSWRLNDCSLAVTLEPCPMCAGAMVNARLGRLIYGAADPKAGACHTLFNIPTDKRLNHCVKIVGGVLSDQCARLLTEFFQRRRMERARKSA